MMLIRHGVHLAVVLCECPIGIEGIPYRAFHFFEWVEWTLSQASHLYRFLRPQSAHLLQGGEYTIGPSDAHVEYGSHI